jgi:hypothetical protein
VREPNALVCRMCIAADKCSSERTPLPVLAFSVCMLDKIHWERVELPRPYPPGSGLMSRVCTWGGSPHDTGKWGVAMEALKRKLKSKCRMCQAAKADRPHPSLPKPQRLCA